MLKNFGLKPASGINRTIIEKERNRCVMGKSHATGWSSYSPTPAQLKEFFAQVESGRINKRNLQAFLKVGPNPYADLIADWEKFYRDLGIEADFSDLVIPEKKEGLDRLIIEADGLSPQKVYDICSRLFKCWKWTNESLDKVITHSDRAGLHAVWVRERQEADAELKNMSANQLKELGISGITFNERGLYEAKYFKETGNHLDISNWTYCIGSRCSGGRVPCVCWSGFLGKMCVDYSHSSLARGPLRAREVVS